MLLLNYSQVFKTLLKVTGLKYDVCLWQNICDKQLQFFNVNRVFYPLPVTLSNPFSDFRNL